MTTMSDGFVHGTDADGQDYRIAALPVTSGTVLMRITGPRGSLALEFELSEAGELTLQLMDAYSRAPVLRCER